MNTLIVLAGLYLIWYSFRVSVFNYESQAVVDAGTPKDKQIYWGSMLVMVIGFVLVALGFTL